MPMVRVPLRWLLVLALTALPGGVSAQPWAEAIKAGDYSKAADLLHPLVVALHQLHGPGDPWPARQLSLLYAGGKGVRRDQIVACAMASVWSTAINVSLVPTWQDPHTYLAGMKDSEEFIRAQCGHLTPHEQQLSGRAFGCLTFDLPPATVAVGQETVWPAFQNVTVVEPADRRLIAELDCYSTIARLREVTLQPPQDAAPGVKPRTFLEALLWEGGLQGPASSVVFHLTWRVFELRNRSIEPVAVERLLSTNRWPRSTLPPDFDARFSVEMIRSGHVRWRMGGEPPKRGWIMLPEGQSR